MPATLYSAGELRRLSRILGALLTLAAGLVLLAQAAWGDLVPPRPGVIETGGEVTSLTRSGTFQQPNFTVTLAYDVQAADGSTEQLRSGQRVPFEVYYRLSEGDNVTVLYDADDPFDWQLRQPEDPLGRYGLALLLTVFGLFWLIFPLLVSWASRQQDFDYSDELDGEPQLPTRKQSKSLKENYEQSTTIAQR